MNIFLLLPPITQLEAFKSNLSKAEPGYEQQEATTVLEREIRIKYRKKKHIMKRQITMKMK